MTTLPDWLIFVGTLWAVALTWLLGYAAGYRLGRLDKRRDDAAAAGAQEAADARSW